VRPSLSDFREHAEILRLSIAEDRPHQSGQYFAVQRCCIKGARDEPALALVLSATAAFASQIGADLDGVDAIPIDELPIWAERATCLAAVLDAISVRDEVLARQRLAQCSTMRRSNDTTH
jgi:hypothetical protein